MQRRRGLPALALAPACCPGPAGCRTTRAAPAGHRRPRPAPPPPPPDSSLQVRLPKSLLAGSTCRRPSSPPRPAPSAPAADPFADEAADGVAAGDKKASKAKDGEGFAVHVRMQQRNGRKSLTTVQGLPEAFDYKKILKALKKGEPRGAGGSWVLGGGGGGGLNAPPPLAALPLSHLPTPCPAPAEYCCNGTVIEDEESGKILQLQGDQRHNVNK